MPEETTIEFTDRYSALGMQRPHTLTVCRGHCEGIGVYPVLDPEVVKEIRPAEDPTEYEIEEIRRIKREHGAEEDGWYFIRCDKCDRTGRCGRLESLRRIPGWLWKAIRFVWDTRENGYLGGGGISFGRRLQIAFG